MKNKNLIFPLLLTLCLVMPAVCNAYSVLLPDSMTTPQLPYIAAADHYNGPACVQMALNSCPTVGARNYHSQDDLYNRIMAHNTESLLWFSDPKGIRDTLMGPFPCPCGYWVDDSNTNKEVVIGSILYWLDRQRYLVPVSITNTEKWVAVCGYWSDFQPTSSSSTVNLHYIYIYDPTPGVADPYRMVAANVWRGDAAYWGAPFNNPASSWHNKYIAIVEPPPFPIIVNIPEWVLSGPILPLDKIESSFYHWLEEVKRNELSRGPFEILAKSHKIGKPLLVDTGSYKYYLIPFADNRLVAIFNAYTGDFEEFRSFKQPQSFILNSSTIQDNLVKTFEKYKSRDVRIMNPQFAYRPALAETGRFSPTWQVQANVTDAKGKKHELTVALNAAGQVIKGLESLPMSAVPHPVTPTTQKWPHLSFHSGIAIPQGNFTDIFKPGINILVDLEYPLKNRFSLRAELGYNQFKSKFARIDDTSIVNFNLNLRYSTSGKPVTFFAEMGPGYYLMKNATDKPGINAGCGIYYKISRWLGLEFASHYHTIFTTDNNTHFLHLAGGLIISFR